MALMTQNYFRNTSLISLMAIDNEQISVLCSRYKQFLTQFELAWISTFTQSHCHFGTTWKHRQWNLTQCVKLRCTYMHRHTGISLHNNCTVQTYRNMLLFHYKHQICIQLFFVVAVWHITMTKNNIYQCIDIQTSLLISKCFDNTIKNQLL